MQASTINVCTVKESSNTAPCFLHDDEKCWVMCHAGLVGNLAGVTSGLLGLDGGALAGRLQLDVLYPVRGFKRCYDKDNGYGKPPLFPMCSQLSLLPMCPPCVPMGSLFPMCSQHSLLPMCFPCVPMCSLFPMCSQPCPGRGGLCRRVLESMLGQ